MDESAVSGSDLARLDETALHTDGDHTGAVPHLSDVAVSSSGVC